MRGKPLRSTVQTIWVALEPGPQLLGDAPVKLLITCTSEKEPFSYFPSERLPLAEISIPSHGTATISSSTPQIRAFPLFWRYCVTPAVPKALTIASTDRKSTRVGKECGSTCRYRW